MTTTNLYSLARGADGQTYRISTANLNLVRHQATMATDKFTHDRGLQCWDEVSAEYYCNNLETNVQKLGVRDE